MRHYVEIDANNIVKGFYVEGINEIPQNAIEITAQQKIAYFSTTFHKTAFVNGVWVEGVTQQEIDELNANKSQPSEIELLKAQNLELRETIDFILTDLIPSLYE